MNNNSYVVVFPTGFSKGGLVLLKSNIKKILKMKKIGFKKVQTDDDVIIIESHDPVFASSAINLLFGIEKVAIAKRVENDFDKIIEETTRIGGNLILAGERFLVRAEGQSYGFLPKDIEIAATSSIIEKKGSLGGKPGTDNRFDKLIYVYLTKKNAYVCIFLDDGKRGLPLGIQQSKAICMIYDEFSAISCLEAIKAGFDLKIVVGYTNKKELTRLVKILVKILQYMIKDSIELEFYNLLVENTTRKFFTKSILVLMIQARCAKELGIENLILSTSQIFPYNFYKYCVKFTFENGFVPICTIYGLEQVLTFDVKDTGIEKFLNSLSKFTNLAFKEPEIANLNDSVKQIMKTRKNITIKIGPNNLHDVLDHI